jgi:hypothetical protein
LEGDGQRWVSRFNTEKSAAAAAFVPTFAVGI